ncbi:hypothetical protein Tco_1192329 [Tanacetum coccineum]
MAESSSHNPSSPKITPKEEPVTLDKPESPNPFLPADQVEFSFEEIALTTNNEVALLYPSHPKSDYFAVVSDFISKCGIRRHIGITTFRNALRAHYLPHSSMYVPPPSITIMSMWTSKLQKLPYKLKRFPKEKSLELKVDSKENNLQNTHLSPRLSFFHLHSESISGCDALADSIAEVDPGKCKPNDSIPSQQDQTKSVGDRLKTTHTDLGTNKELRSDKISKKIKPEDLSDLMKDTRCAFFTPDSPQDEPIIVSDESEKVETEKDKDTHATSHDVPEDTLVPHPPSSKSAQIQELMAQGMEIELPGDLNDIPTKLETFTSTVSSLMSQVAELKTLKWELSTEFLALPSQISSVQAKLQTLDTLPSILNKVANTLNREDGTTEVIPNVKVSDLHLG